MQNLMSANEKLKAELGESENKVASLSSSMQASSPMKKVQSMEKNIKTKYCDWKK